MKIKKNFFVALLLVCSLCVTCLPAFASASEVTSDVLADTDIQLPADAVILYKDEDVVLYQSREASAMPREVSGENNYGYAWVNAGSSLGSFPVRNTCTGEIGVTWKVEASSSADGAQIYMKNPSGATIISTQTVYARDGDVRLTMRNAVNGTYTVHYIPVKNSNGMRVMCWTYYK